MNIPNTPSSSKYDLLIWLKTQKEPINMKNVNLYKETGSKDLILQSEEGITHIFNADYIIRMVFRIHKDS